MKKQFHNWIIPIAMVVIVILGVVLVVVLKSGAISKDSLFGKALYATTIKTSTSDMLDATIITTCESFVTNMDSPNKDKTPGQICADVGKTHINTMVYHWTGNYFKPEVWPETEPMVYSFVDSTFKDYSVTTCCKFPEATTTAPATAPTTEICNDDIDNDYDTYIDCDDWDCTADPNCVSPTPSCGDGTCDAGEDCSTCEADCGVCSPGGGKPPKNK